MTVRTVVAIDFKNANPKMVVFDNCQRSFSVK
jgi:hypothetical protein